jgi:arsenate reductase
MNTTVRLYGIESCDQVRRARQWLRARGVSVHWHDFRRDGLDSARLASWTSRLPWDALLNRRGLTWRQLPSDERAAVVDATSATELMLRQPTLIKRPVLELDERILVGFSEALYASVFGPNPTPPLNQESS